MASKSEYDTRLARCIEYRKTPTASLKGWTEIMDEEYGLKEGQAIRDYAKAGDIMKTEKEEERAAYLSSLEAKLDKVHTEAIDGILSIKKDNQNTKKMALSFIKQLQDRLDTNPDELQELLPHINKLIDTINKSNYNEAEVIKLMGKWRGLEAPQNQINIQSDKINIQWGNEQSSNE